MTPGQGLAFSACLAAAPEMTSPIDGIPHLRLECAALEGQCRAAWTCLFRAWQF